MSAAAAADPMQKPALIAMCASHIADEQRVVTLVAMLHSWQAQTCLLPLLLSVSFANDALKERVRGALGVFANVPLVTIERSRRSQFEHYAATVEELATVAFAPLKPVQDMLLANPRAPVFVLFSDDDDAWDTKRAEIFGHILDERHATGELPTLYAVHEEVDGDKTEAEYFHFCVRFSSFAAFVRRADPLLLKHRYADCYFRRYLLTPQGRLNMPNHGTDMARFSYVRPLYRYASPTPHSVQQVGRAHRNPYDDLLVAFRSKFETQKKATDALHAVLTTYSMRAQPESARARIEAENAHFQRELGLLKKVSDAISRLVILSGFCIVMASRYNGAPPPSFDEFRRSVQLHEDRMDAFTGASPRTTYSERLPDALKSFYQELVAKDPECLRFIHAPVIVASD